MDKRLHSRLANPQNYIMPTYRINNAWKQEEARIISEQAQKDALQQQATQEAARAIANLERQEAERNPWIAASKMTAIQGINRANNLQTRRNEEENNIESWANSLSTRMITTQPSDAYIDDSTHNSWVESSNNATNANNLIGSWRNGYRVPAIDIGNSNQFARLSGGYGEAGSAADVLTGEGSYMMNLAQNRGNHQYTSEGTVAPGVGIDDIEEYGYYVWEEVEEHRTDIEEMVNEAERHAREIMGDFLFDFAMGLLNIVIGKQVKKPIEILILLYGIYQCAEEAYKEEIQLYRQEYNCSYDEAKEMVRPGTRFVKKFWSMMMGDWLNEVLERLGIPMPYRNAIIHTVNEVFRIK